VRKIIGAVKHWFGRKPARGGHTALVYVYSPAKGEPGGEAGINEIFAMLRRLSSFSAREGLPITVILPGRPLRKLPENARQNDVLVKFALPDQLLKVTAAVVRETRQSHSCVVVTDKPEVETFARGERLRHLRASTFEKTLDATCGPLRRDSQQPPRRPPAHPAPHGQGQQGVPQKPKTEEAPEAPPSEKPARPAPAPEKTQEYEPVVEKREQDRAVLDLIDPL
jgi:hypothetical protein